MGLRYMSHVNCKSWVVTLQQRSLAFWFPFHPLLTVKIYVGKLPHITYLIVLHNYRYSSTRMRFSGWSNERFKSYNRLSSSDFVLSFLLWLWNLQNTQKHQITFRQPLGLIKDFSELLKNMNWIKFLTSFDD